MFHELATEKTRQYVEQFPEVKKGLTEICHALQFKVLTHNEHHMKSVYSEADAMFSVNSESGKRRIRNALEFLLIDGRNMPIGVFYVADGTDREGATVPAYCFVSEFITKERGRGVDRNTRESIKLPALIKMLKKEWASTTPENMIKTMGREMGGSVVNRINNELNGKYHRIDLNNEAEVALINMYFNQTIITNTKVIDTLNKAKQSLENMKKDEAAAQEALEAFKKKVNFIIQFDECPMMVGSATFFSQSASDNKYLIHPDVNYYLSPDHVPEAYKQLLVDYKMWYIKNERPSEDKRTIDHTQFKVFPFNREKYDSDLGIVTDSGRKYVFNRFGNFTLFISPAPSTDEVANVN